MNQLFLRAVAIDWDAVPRDAYVRGIPALQFQGPLTLPAAVTCLVGENGSGKSTLLEGIAAALGFSREGGSLNHRVFTYEEADGLGDSVRLIRGVRKPRRGYFLRAESLYNVATKAEEYRLSGLGVSSKEDYYARFGGRSLHDQSHGEGFLHLVQGEFGPDGLYLLDEPEAALSPQRQLTLLYEVHRLSKAGAQFVIATHSPILLGLPEAALLSFDEGAIHPIGYRETASYQVMEMFINRRDGFLRQLLGEELP